jgi:6-phosphogluconolactonase (cycloisomerase 2 family)
MHYRLLYPLTLLWVAAFSLVGCGGSSATEEGTANPPASATYVYAANPATSEIAGFRANESTGALTPMPGLPIATPGVPVALAIDPEARFAYVGMRRSAIALAAYSIDARTEALALVPSSELGEPPMPPVQGGGGRLPGEHLNLSSLTLDPSGRLAFVVFDHYCDVCICGVWAWLYSYAVDPDSGRLRRLDTPPVFLGRAGAGDTPPEGRSVVAVSHDRFLYTASLGVSWGGPEACSEDSYLKGFSADQSGSGLRALGTFAAGTPNAGDGARWLAVRPSGDYLYLGREHDTLAFEVNTAIGALKPIGTFPAMGVSIFSPSGSLYAAVTDGRGSGIQVYDVQPGTGDLVRRTDSFSRTPGRVTQIASDVRGRLLYAVSSRAGLVSAFAIDAATGDLHPAPGDPLPGGPTPTGSWPLEIGFRALAVADAP